MLRKLTMAALTALACIGSSAALASDHGDVPVVLGAGRVDLNLSDLHAFTVFEDGDHQLVLSMCSNTGIPTTFGGSYIFPTDAKFRFFVDNGPSESVPADAASDVYEDVTFDVTFETVTDESGASSSVPTVMAHGLKNRRHEQNPPAVKVFTGLTDDPFIRAPRNGRNVASIVLRIPLGQVLADGQTTLRVWATTEWPDVEGQQLELAGAPLDTMAPSRAALNAQHPSMHATPPSVLTFDVTSAAAFPNGRALEDDVVDLVGAMFPGVAGRDVRNTEGCGNVGLGTYTNCNATNDRPFRATFPYLAEPRPPQ
jgi:hypothetical protein